MSATIDEAAVAGVRAQWETEQLALARAVVLDDAAMGFLKPVSAHLAVPPLPSGAALPPLPAAPAPPADVPVRSWAGVAAARPAPTQPPLTRIGGVDVSFVKDTNYAVASLVVLSFPALEVLHTEMREVEMPCPYIAGFLAFREVPVVRPLLEALRQRAPQLMPQVVLVDGNGVHHPRRCGFASHLGVECDVPTVGCAKNLLVVDGLDRDTVEQRLQAFIAAGSGPVMPLIGHSGAAWGYAALTGNSTKNPIYISAGHRISQTTAAEIVLLTTKFRVPEPIRHADLLSREYIRKRGVAAQANDAKKS